MRALSVPAHPAPAAIDSSHTSTMVKADTAVGNVVRSSMEKEYTEQKAVARLLHWPKYQFGEVSFFSSRSTK